MTGDYFLVVMETKYQIVPHTTCKPCLETLLEQIDEVQNSQQVFDPWSDRYISDDDTLLCLSVTLTVSLYLCCKLQIYTANIQFEAPHWRRPPDRSMGVVLFSPCQNVNNVTKGTV